MYVRLATSHPTMGLKGCWYDGAESGKLDEALKLFSTMATRDCGVDFRAIQRVQQCKAGPGPERRSRPHVSPEAANATIDASNGGFT